MKLIPVCVFVLLQSLTVFGENFLEWLVDQDEASRIVVASGDSMVLYVDVSAAKQFPQREDLHLRVYTVAKNVTLCDAKLFEYVEQGQYPCTVHEKDAQFHTGVNHLELEVYSTLTGTRYAKQRISEIHHMDQVVMDGYYDDFYLYEDTNAYATKVVATGLVTSAVARAVVVGRDAFVGEIQSLILAVLSAIKLPQLGAAVFAAVVMPLLRIVTLSADMGLDIMATGILVGMKIPGTVMPIIETIAHFVANLLQTVWNSVVSTLSTGFDGVIDALATVLMTIPTGWSLVANIASKCISWLQSLLPKTSVPIKSKGKGVTPKKGAGQGPKPPKHGPPKRPPRPTTSKTVSSSSSGNMQGLAIKGLGLAVAVFVLTKENNQRPQSLSVKPIGHSPRLRVASAPFDDLVCPLRGMGLLPKAPNAKKLLVKTVPLKPKAVVVKVVPKPVAVKVVPKPVVVKVVPKPVKVAPVVQKIDPAVAAAAKKKADDAKAVKEANEKKARADAELKARKAKEAAAAAAQAKKDATAKQEREAAAAAAAKKKANDAAAKAVKEANEKKVKADAAAAQAKKDAAAKQEREAAAAKKKANDAAAAKKKADDAKAVKEANEKKVKADAAAAQVKKDAAAKQEREAAAAAKKKADDAAAAKKKADNEKKVKADAAAAQAKKDAAAKQEREAAAAAKKKADDAAALKKKTADDAAAAKRKADEAKAVKEANEKKARADAENKARIDADKKAKAKKDAADAAAAAAAAAVKKASVVKKVTPKPVKAVSTEGIDDLVCPLRGMGLLPALEPVSSNNKK